MQILPITYDRVLYVAQNMRADDAHEIFCVKENQSRVDYAKELIDIEHQGFVAGLGNHPIALFMCVLISSNIWPKNSTWNVGMFATDDWHKIAKPATRYVKQTFMPYMFELGLKRAECLSHQSHKTAHQWLKFLGFQQQKTIPLKDFYQFTYHKS